MKKLITLTIALFLLAAGNVFGQSTDDATLNASADIIATGLDIEELRALDFGVLAAGSTSTIAFNSANAGALDITGESEQNIYINAPSEITLTRDGGSETMTINSLTFGTNTEDDAENASSYTLNNPVELSDDDPGKLYFYVGGELEVSGGQATGLYEGSATIEVSYNSF